jgi:hypothetical protein
MMAERSSAQKFIMSVIAENSPSFHISIKVNSKNPLLTQVLCPGSPPKLESVTKKSTMQYYDLKENKALTGNSLMLQPGTDSVDRSSRISS